MRVAVLEAAQKRRDQLEEFIKRFAAERGEAISLDLFAQPERLLAEYTPVYDIIFLAVGEPEIDGMRAAQRLRELDRTVVLVFVTSMERYAIQGYRVDALDFILMPCRYSTFQIKMERAVLRAAARTDAHIALQATDGLHRVNIREITYVEAQNRMVVYHTLTGAIWVKSPLREEEQRLAPYHFSKCNQCYLVNLQHVRDVTDDFVRVGDSRLEISRRRRKGFLEAVIEYIGGD